MQTYYHQKYCQCNFLPNLLQKEAKLLISKVAIFSISMLRQTTYNILNKNKVVSVKSTKGRLFVMMNHAAQKQQSVSDLF